MALVVAKAGAKESKAESVWYNLLNSLLCPQNMLRSRSIGFPSLHQ